MTPYLPTYSAVKHQWTEHAHDILDMKIHALSNFVWLLATVGESLAQGSVNVG
jgi:hypothetical protein